MIDMNDLHCKIMDGEANNSRPLNSIKSYFFAINVGGQSLTADVSHQFFGTWKMVVWAEFAKRLTAISPQITLTKKQFSIVCEHVNEL